MTRPSRGWGSSHVPNCDVCCASQIPSTCQLVSITRIPKVLLTHASRNDIEEVGQNLEDGVELENNWVLQTQAKEDGAGRNEHAGGISHLSLDFAGKYLHPDEASNHSVSNEDLAGPVEVFKRAEPEAIGSIYGVAPTIIVAIIVVTPIIVSRPWVSTTPVPTPPGSISIPISPVAWTRPISLDKAHEEECCENSNFQCTSKHGCNVSSVRLERDVKLR